MTKSTRFLDLLHFDLEGPLPTTFRGYRYFLIVKYDYTGLMFIYALKTKSEAFAKLKELKSYLELQSGQQWRRACSNWGGEFNSAKSILWFKNKGIAWELSEPYTPQQNGKDERSMYTIMSAVWSVMEKKRLAKSLWNEIASGVVYVRNRCPSTEGKTPFEKCNEEPPDVSNLRVLGCHAWVQVLNTTSRTSSHSRSIYNPLTKRCTSQGM